jgi:hypothetical protein
MACYRDSLQRIGLVDTTEEIRNAYRNFMGNPLVKPLLGMSKGRDDNIKMNCMEISGSGMSQSV